MKWVHDSCCNSRAFCACAGPKNCTNTSPSISWAQTFRVVTNLCFTNGDGRQKNTLGTMMQSTKHLGGWLRYSRKIPGVYTMLSHVWEEFDPFCMTSTNCGKTTLLHMDTSSVSTKLKISNSSRYDDFRWSTDPSKSKLPALYWVKIGKITIEKLP